MIGDQHEANEFVPRLLKSLNTICSSATVRAPAVAVHTCCCCDALVVAGHHWQLSQSISKAQLTQPLLPLLGCSCSWPATQSQRQQGTDHAASAVLLRALLPRHHPMSHHHNYHSHHLML
eukprot:4782-Heterococcus_DN1.PRE.5